MPGQVYEPNSLSNTPRAVPLPNRGWFLKSLKNALAQATRRHTGLAVLVVEPCRPVEAGDVAATLGGLVSPNDCVASLDGSRLGVLLASTSAHACRLVASRAQSALRPLAPVAIGMRAVVADADGCLDASLLLHQATKALEEARECGGDLLVAWEDMIWQTM